MDILFALNDYHSSMIPRKSGLDISPRYRIGMAARIENCKFQ